MELLELLNNLDEHDLLEAWNAYCEANSYYDDMIYSMEELDDLLTGSALDILDAIDLEAFNTNDKYIKATVFGWTSSDYIEDWIYFEDLAAYIEREGVDFGIVEIEEWLENE